MKAIHKEFWMEIRKSKARFISIFFIVALGVAFFSGIQAASPDMRFSGDAYYDSVNLMDMKVIGTMGLTDEDVTALKEVSGVEDAEGAYFTDVLCGDNEAQKVLHIESVTEKVNQVTPKEGRIPEKSGEIFLDHAFAEKQKYKVGDTITLKEDGDSEFLKTKKYTVVGVGSSPLYISFNRGNTTLGSGEVNGFAYVMPQDFDQEVFTQIYLKVHGAKGLTSYTDGYDNLIGKITERVEGIEEVRCKARYDEVTGEAQEKIDDAKEELEDGKKTAKKELADAKKKLKDGQKEYDDGKKEYDDGVKKLADAKAELSDGKKELADAKQKIADGRAALNDAQAKLNDGKARLATAKKELADGWAEVNANQKKLDDGYAKLSAARKQLSDGKKQIENAKATLTAKQAELDAGKQQIADGKQQIPEARAELEAKKQQCMEGLAEVEAGEAQAAEGQAAIDAAYARLEPVKQQLAQLQTQYEAMKESGAYTEEELGAMNAQVQELSAQLAAAQTQIDEQAAQLEAAKAQLAASRAELEGGLSQIEDGLTQLAAKEQELARIEASLPGAQAQIDQGWADLKAEEDKLAPAQKEIKKNQKTLDASQAELDKAKKKLKSGQAEIDKNQAEMISGQAEIDAGIAEMNSGQKEIDKNEQKLIDGEKEIADNEKKLADAKVKLADAKKELKKGKKEYKDGKADAEKEIADGEKKLADAQKELDDLDMPEWMISDRHDQPEYSDYGDNADRIRNIGKVFPVIFFLVAALISLTTMTRMVEEQRTQIGTMKSLGYGKFSIASKYLNYAFLATVGGCVLGVLIGEKILPYIIITAYGIMYHNMSSSLMIHYEFKFALIASVAAVVCTVGATIFSCYKALSETPASLMRPPAPKEGKRVWVERIGILWIHLSFTWKSTLRNLFRYKKRLFMTVFGIAGSMALMLVGYGIQDSVMDIALRQYSQLQHYDGTIISDEDATKKERRELMAFLDENEKIVRYNPVQLTKMTVPMEKSSLSVYVYVPEDLEAFKEDVTLQNRRTKKQYELTDEGAVICEKTATLMGLSVGDEITISKDNKDFTAKVAAITENYMGHYIYMTENVYAQTFGEKPKYENMTFSVKDEYEDQLDKIGKEILKYPAALSISYTGSLAEQLDRMLGALGTVIIVLIVSAGMLAFVVLYNLNNINITERQRELATLKVLGFYDMEVSEYVFRENILLTIIGVAAGAFFGILLHKYIITTVEVDAVMFGRNIKPMSFLYSGLFTCGFSLFVNMTMHFKLKKIDMVESLKSVE